MEYSFIISGNPIPEPPHIESGIKHYKPNPYKTRQMDKTQVVNL
jgi:hypothetical protein